METVSGPIEVGRHNAAVVGSMLAIVGLAQLEPGDLCDGVGLVRWLQRPAKQGLFRNGLRRQSGVDAGRSEKQEPLHARPPRLVNDIHFDDQVVVDEICRVSGVGQNAPDFRRSQDHHIRPLGLHEGTGRSLIAEIEFASISCDHIRTAVPEAPQHGRSNHALVACEKITGHCGHVPRDNGVPRPRLWSKLWRRAAERSSRTISAHIISTVVSGLQPSFSLALDVSPTSDSTSAGRK